MKQLSGEHQAVLRPFRKPPHSCTEGMCHSSTSPPNVQVRHCMRPVLPGLPSCYYCKQKTLEWEGLGTRQPLYLITDKCWTKCNSPVTYTWTTHTHIPKERSVQKQFKHKGWGYLVREVSNTHIKERKFCLQHIPHHNLQLPSWRAAQNKTEQKEFSNYISILGYLGIWNMLHSRHFHMYMYCYHLWSVNL